MKPLGVLKILSPGRILAVQIEKDRSLRILHRYPKSVKRFDGVLSVMTKRNTHFFLSHAHSPRI